MHQVETNGCNTSNISFSKKDGIVQYLYRHKDGAMDVE